jgi:phenylalanine-4-hydroxylase
MPSAALLDVQPFDRYTDADQATWSQLLARQRPFLDGRAHPRYLACLDALGLPTDRLPDLAEVSKRLTQLSGWSLVPCEGLVHEDVFFDLLVHRKFPVTWWIRKPDQLDYLPEPDLFHDLFGHVPLLADPDFSAYMEAYGRAGQQAKARSRKALRQLTRLYWWTVEFGLIQSNPQDKPLIYGAGIVSSMAEAGSSSPLPGEGPGPRVRPFDLERALRTKFIYTDIQPSYFVIQSFSDLTRALEQDLDALYDKIAPLPVLAP